ncbi:MAG: molybdopterin cofactor-binding domain-containing protein, partial [Thermodesulfobacteriota bacterium]|nr:molybdopterin cofactor-binding domain-containing protein [Thermodesulfobacteriota bacterium]
SIKIGRPVKWIEDRRENLTAGQCGSDRILEAEAAVKKDGTILAIKTKIIDNVGAYLRFPEPIGLIRAFQTVLGCYKIKNLLMDLYTVNTNELPSGPNRGYGCQSFYFQLERLVDLVGKKLGLDPVEIRKRNFIQPEEFPYTTAVGCIYDSGNYQETLRKALEMVDYEKIRKEQERLRKEGKYTGIGITTIVEPAASNMAEFFIVTEKFPLSGSTEAAKVKIEPSGKITASVGSCPQGQGHETIVAQIIADEFSVNTDDVHVLPGFDSSTHPWTTASGTWGSRFAAVGPDAVILACRKIKEKVFKIAAHILHDKPENLEMKDGMVQVKGTPQKALPLEAVSGMSYYHTLVLPPDMEPGLEATHVFNFPTVNMPDDKRRINLASTYGNSVHIAVVEVDIETGQVKILKYIVVSDCGKMINPMTVDGQIHGGVIHGIGGGLQEELIYDDDGQLLTATFIDYLVPTAVEAPNIEVGHIETPSPFNILGTKGMGEGGSIPSPAVLASAVEDALSPFGVTITELPLAPEKIWKSIKSKK